MSIDFRRVREHLQSFDFRSVFIEELGWSNPPRALRSSTFTAAGVELSRRPIAELAGFVVFEVKAADGTVPDAKARAAAHKVIGGQHHEHVLVFVDRAEQKSVWSWVHRKEKRDHLRTHYYFRGQPGDLFIGKLGAMMFDLRDFDREGNVPIVEVADRVRKALDVEGVTKRFYAAFQAQHGAFLELVTGIADERQRRWYVSVLLNRLMFIYFLQRKGFLDGGKLDYLQDRLAWSRRELGEDRYFSGFLKLLFFEGFAKPLELRSAEARARLGRIRYLNGGLFLPHRVELDNPSIDVPDRAFEGLLQLFGSYTWHLDDTPGGDDSAINPDVLGYIFEKYINQKSFGAYYTRPEITDWLCEQTIHRHVLDRVNQQEEGARLAGLDASPARFEEVSDLLLNLTPALCRSLLTQVLPKLSVLDPACGSGAFLVAALKTMHNLYGAVVGAVKVLPDAGLRAEVAEWERRHPSLGYFIKKRVITDNLHGVDIMEEATEIARLRLFLALVASATREEELEPLPNVDFNIMPGNSLVGLLRVKDEQFNRHGQGDLFAPTYRQLVDEKNRLVETYRHATTYAEDLASLRDDIEARKNKARDRLNEILREDFVELGIRFEQPRWDDKKGDVGKSEKRPLRLEDIRALHPFHWDYEFDDVMRAKGGFDVILANPPWEVFKPNAKEFFQEYSDVISKNNMRIEDFEREQARLLRNPDIRHAWLEYLARFPHVNAFYRSAEQYQHQVAAVAGKRTGTDINLYKLFVEQCLNLLRPGGQLGMVVPSSVYTDMGAMKLREVLLDQNSVHALFGLSNERYMFEGVHHSFRVCLLVVTKGGQTSRFVAAFRTNPRDAVGVEQLAEFLRDHREHLEITPKMVRKTAPGTLSVMEFKSAIDVRIVEKMLNFPLFGDPLKDVWSLELTREFHMTDDSKLFLTKPGKGSVALFEGKTVHQFEPHFADPRYWIDRAAGRDALRPARQRRALDAAKKAGTSLDEVSLARLSLDTDAYRLGFRKYARNTDERTLIATVVPRDVFVGESLTVHRPFRDVYAGEKHKEVPVLSGHELLLVVAVLNSYIADWLLRLRVSSTINMFYVEQLPVPRLTSGDKAFGPIVDRAARLTCTTPEFDALAKAVGLGSHKNGVTDPKARAQLRAEIDGLVAHLYGLTEEEFAHVLQTFPVVPEPVREAAKSAFRAVARGEVT